MYCKHEKDKFRSKYPGVLAKPLMEIMWKAYKALTDSARAKYEELSHKDKIRYKHESERYEKETGKEVTKRIIKPRARKMTGPKRPLTAFFCF